MNRFEKQGTTIMTPPVPVLRRLAVALAVTFAAGAPAFAADGPSFDCAKADSEAEELVCSDPKLAALDRRLAERYAAALAVAEGLDAGADSAVADLKATQRGWIGGRNECWKADDKRACVEAAYLTREGELVAGFMLEAPTGTARWMCGGNPANELYAAFFDTELPSVRLEYGDSIDTGSLSRTGSGSRYDASFGRYIWMKGDEATFVWTEGEEQTCTVAG